jgi:hypothetical protein
MFSSVFQSLFGCWHGRYSFPITVKRGRRSAAALVTGTYVVCLDCGKELPYDWQRMRIVGSPAERTPVAAALATKQVL